MVSVGGMYKPYVDIWCCMRSSIRYLQLVYYLPLHRETHFTHTLRVNKTIWRIEQIQFQLWLCTFITFYQPRYKIAWTPFQHPPKFRSGKRCTQSGYQPSWWTKNSNKLLHVLLFAKSRDRDANIYYLNIGSSKQPIWYSSAACMNKEADTKKIDILQHWKSYPLIGKGYKLVIFYPYKERPYCNWTDKQCRLSSGWSTSHILLFSASPKHTRISQISSQSEAISVIDTNQSTQSMQRELENSARSCISLLCCLLWHSSFKREIVVKVQPVLCSMQSWVPLCGLSRGLGSGSCSFQNFTI